MRPRPFVRLLVEQPTRSTRSRCFSRIASTHLCPIKPRWQHLSDLIQSYHPSVCRQNIKSDHSLSRYRSRGLSTRISFQQEVNKSQNLALSAVRAYIALGSNVGDRLKLIEDACRALHAQDGISLRRTSGLWETKAMYVLDQNDFLNGVCEIETTLEPLELLDRLQAIETTLGRRKTIDKGPRSIDLDVLLYDDLVVEEERLKIPHPLMFERGFVLQPLCQLMPDASAPGPKSGNTFSKFLEQLSASELPISTMTPITSVAHSLLPLRPSRSTKLMSIINLTPDSFSDGGILSSSDLAGVADAVRSIIAVGATIIDIGGQSTRPRAEDVGAEEEKERVIPALDLISSVIGEQGLRDRVSISIDTYRASVAKAAVEAGAQIVNDVSAGLMDPDMLPTVAKLGCSMILMHMRGNPSNMMSKENTSYPDGLIPTVGAELKARVEAAEAAGIRRWRMILDPGIGFAKTQAQNLEILRRLGDLRAIRELSGMPWVVGVSRKGFIGKITGAAEPRERVWGTAAAVTASIQGGADIVRVHDVREMEQVVKMADAIWRVE